MQLSLQNFNALKLLSNKTKLYILITVVCTHFPIVGLIKVFFLFLNHTKVEKKIMVNILGSLKQPTFECWNSHIYFQLDIGNVFNETCSHTCLAHRD